MNNLTELEGENRRLKQKLSQLKQHSKNLEGIFYQIVSAKAFKLWQAFNKLKKLIKQSILNPKKILKAVKILFTQGPKGVIEKLKSQEQQLQHSLTINQQYQIWLKKNYPTSQELLDQKTKQKKFKYRPKISIITPVYNTPEKFLRECIESVINQTYDNWELCLVDDASTDAKVRKIIKEYAERAKPRTETQSGSGTGDKRIKYKFRKTNGHICRASNDALKLATGEFTALLDHDDELKPHALYKVVELLNKHKNVDFIYSDEDKLELDGRQVDPFFKPDWSPDMFLSTNYLCHLSVIRKKLVDKVGGFRPGFEGSQDYDLFLRVTEKTNKIHHIPDILYSWRKVPGSTATVYEVKSYANQASINALTEALNRRNINGSVTNGLVVGTFRVKYKLIDKPSISIIIPTKDKVEYLKRCITSIFKNTTYKNYRIVIVDTGSIEKKTLAYYKKIKNNKKIKFLNWKGKKFNYSAVNNFGVKNTKSDYVLLLNNDTEVITPDWIESMLEHAQRKEVGVVGVKLLYPDNKIQHAGIILGIGDQTERRIAGHAQKMFDDKPTGLAIWNSKDLIRNYSGVTAACLMISRKKYIQVNGLNEKFRIAFNDVDFCLELLKKDYVNVYTPYVKLYHHESISVGKPETENRDMKEFNKEINMMLKKWDLLLQNDPYYNPNLTLDREDFSINILNNG